MTMLQNGLVVVSQIVKLEQFIFIEMLTGTILKYKHEIEPDQYTLHSKTIK